jgi:hypothetical protein
MRSPSTPSRRWCRRFAASLLALSVVCSPVLADEAASSEDTEAPATKPGRFDGGKLLATGGVSQLEGAGGGGLAPWALITGYGTDAGIGGNAHYTAVYVDDWVKADRAKLLLILKNLLSNAAKFTPAGGSATLRAQAPGPGWAEITVSDTGIGMNPEDIPVALTPFGQVDSRLSRKYEGTGLGLALVNVFVERHGGALSIDTAPGHGTSVTVMLAAVDPPAAQLRAAG